MIQEILNLFFSNQRTMWYHLTKNSFILPNVMKFIFLNHLQTSMSSKNLQPKSSILRCLPSLLLPPINTSLLLPPINTSLLFPPINTSLLHLSFQPLLYCQLIHLLLLIFTRVLLISKQQHHLLLLSHLLPIHPKFCLLV